MRRVVVILLALCMVLSMAACGGGDAPATAAPPGRDAAGEWIFDGTVLVGRVVPLTGGLSSFGEGTPYVEQTAIDAINGRGGVVLDGVRCRLELVYADSGSTVAGAGLAAVELIGMGIDIMIVSNTADTVLPVSTACERAGIACISVDAPASAWAMGGPYQNSWHTFFDNEREMLCFFDAWEQIDSNRTIGLITANDSEGIEITTFITDFAASKGYTIIDPGRYTIGQADYSGIVKTFDEAGCDIILGVMITSDFSVFWDECRQQGYYPKMCTVAKACLFPADVEAMGAAANGLITEVWWTEDFPYYSSINGWSSAELGADYRDNYSLESSLIPPTVGYKHANVEILYDILARAGSMDLHAINSAAAQTELDTVVGHVAFNEDHIAIMSCVTGQWIMNADGSYRQEIVGNYLIPAVDITAEIILIPGSEGEEHESVDR